MTAETTMALLEQVVIGGDLSRLAPADRLSYYKAVCESVGLNPLTRPLEYLQLSGKLVLYARKDATDQLRKLHGVSITRLEREVVEGLYVVTAYARDLSGREDSEVGAVNIDTLKGEARANAIMKAVTKAKRRVTLSICGLGMLDETEVETVVGARPVAVDPITGELPTSNGQPEDREGLLEKLRVLGQALKLSEEEKRRLWARYCGEADAESVDVAALGELYAALQAKANGPVQTAR